jgi:hypothetical protein
VDERYADTGSLALADLLGVRREGVFEQTHAYIEVTDPRLSPGTLDLPHLAEAKFVLARPVADDVQVLAKLRQPYLRSDGQFLLRWSPAGEDSGYPAITLRRCGRGWAVYLAGDVFHAYQVKNQWNLKHIVANLLRLTVRQPPVTVTAPAWLEIVLRRQPAESAPGQRERVLVHLVNQHGDRPLDNNNRCVEQLLPVTRVKVTVRLPTRPTAVTLEPGGVSPRWSYSRGTLTVAVPQVSVHTAVAIAL